MQPISRFAACALLAAAPMSAIAVSKSGSMINVSGGPANDGHAYEFVSTDSTGAGVMCWTRIEAFPEGGGVLEVQFRQFTADGTLGPVITIPRRANSIDAVPSCVLSTDGAVHVGYASIDLPNGSVAHNTIVRYSTASGIGQPIELSTTAGFLSYPAVSLAAVNGEVWVAHSELKPQLPLAQIYLDRFAADGTAVSTGQVLESYDATSSDGLPAAGMLAVAPAGQYVGVGYLRVGTSNGTQMAYKRLALDGSIASGEVLVPHHGRDFNGIAATPFIAAGDDGSMALTWSWKDDTGCDTNPDCVQVYKSLLTRFDASNTLTMDARDISHDSRDASQLPHVGFSRDGTLFATFTAFQALQTEPITDAVVSVRTFNASGETGASLDLRSPDGNIAALSALAPTAVGNRMMLSFVGGATADLQSQSVIYMQAVSAKDGLLSPVRGVLQQLRGTAGTLRGTLLGPDGVLPQLRHWVVDVRQACEQH